MNLPELDPSIVRRVLDLAVEIQQIPAPTFSEQKRAAFILGRFKDEGLAYISQDQTGGVYACIPGRGTSRPIVVSAHIDTVFSADFDLSITRGDDRISAPGIGDNALGVAALFGLVWSMREAGIQLPGDVWLAANVAEEGLGNLLGMQAVVDRFGAEPIAYLVLEGMSYGRIYHRGLGVQRFRISTHTSGGHSWSDYGRPSAVHALAGIVHRLNAIPLSEKPRTTLNVGIFHGGISINTIAPSASLELDLRSENLEALDTLVARVEDLVAHAAESDLEVRMESIGRRPVGVLAAEHPLVATAVEVLQALGVQPRLSVGSTDANVPLSRAYPAICIGITTGGGAHSAAEYIDIPPVFNGLVQLHTVVRSSFERLGN